MNHFADRLTQAVQTKQTPLVVGIDPRVNQLPKNFSASDSDTPIVIANKVASYSIDLIDAVEDLIPAIKPQAAFFEKLGPHGCRALATVVDHAKSKGLIVIMDAKRGDIGSTAQAYAEAYLGPKPGSAWGCDCLTVNPYLGKDTLEPFVTVANETNSGLFVLAKTSNPGSGWLQSVEQSEAQVFQMVADEIQTLSKSNLGQCGYGNIGAVVGATYPEQLSELRQRMPNTLFLIPGFGAQGGTAADVAGGLDDNGLGGLINSSRGIIFAYEKKEYAHLPWTDSVRQATIDTIERIADGTSASRLIASP